MSSAARAFPTALSLLALALLVACSPQGAPSSSSDAAAPAPPAIAPPVSSVPLLSPEVRARLRLHEANPTKPDPRSADELAQAACRSPDGAWHCAQVRPKPMVRGAFGGPLNPTSWTVPAWFVDPTNVSGTASDSNSCTSSGSPCLTWRQINDIRWGCLGNPTGCPLLAQNTTVTFLSSQSGPTDAMVFRPVIGTTALGVAPTILLQGTITTVTTGAISSLTALARSSNTKLSLEIGSGTTGTQGQFLQDTTRNSFAWAFTKSGVITTISQPFQPYSVATSGSPVPAGTEDAGWANTDSITVGAMSQVWISEVSPTFASLQGEGVVLLYHLEVPELLSQGIQPGDDPVRLGYAVQAIESNFQKNVALVYPGISYTSNIGLFNCALDGGLSVSGVPTQSQGIVGATPYPIVGGYVQSKGGGSGGLAGTGAFAAAGVLFDGDVIVKNGAGKSILSGHSYVGLADFDSAFVLEGTLDLQTLALYGSHIAYGTGSFDALGGQLVYAAGAGAAAAALPINGGIKAYAQTKGCLMVPGAASAYGTCNITLSAANLDANLGATSGCLVAGTSAFCNMGI